MNFDPLLFKKYKFENVSELMIILYILIIIKKSWNYVIIP